MAAIRPMNMVTRSDLDSCRRFSDPWIRLNDSKMSEASSNFAGLRESNLYCDSVFSVFEFFVLLPGHSLQRQPNSSYESILEYLYCLLFHMNAGFVDARRWVRPPANRFESDRERS